MLSFSKLLLDIYIQIITSQKINFESVEQGCPIVPHRAHEAHLPGIILRRIIFLGVPRVPSKCALFFLLQTMLNLS